MQQVLIRILGSVERATSVSLSIRLSDIMMSVSVSLMLLML